MKTYTFEDVSYWSSNGCDCCDDEYVEAYNCTEEGWELGTSYSIGECFIMAIMHSEGIEYGADHYEHIDMLYDMTFEELEAKAEELNIRVVVQ